MRKILLFLAVASLISTVFLIGCTTGEAQKKFIIVGENEEQINKAVDLVLSKEFPTTQKKALAGHAYGGGAVQISAYFIESGQISEGKWNCCCPKTCLPGDLDCSCKFIH